MDKAKLNVIKVVTVTVVAPCDRMLRIEEEPEVGYYARLDAKHVKHVYLISRNIAGFMVLGYIAPFHRIKHTKINAIIRINFNFDIKPETCVVNYDGVYKNVTGYRFNKLIFDLNYKGFYLAWRELDKIDDTRIVYKDRIKRGSQLRIVVPNGSYPKQTVLYHGNRLVIQALTGVFYVHHGEFDMCGAKPATHYLMRCDFMRIPATEELPYAFEYQKVHAIDGRRTIVYTVIPIVQNNKPLGIADMFPMPPKLVKRGNAKRK
jgi:hypothetical protein